MTTFRLTPEMQTMIARAKANGGKVICDPRRMYPTTHICAARTRPQNTGPYIKSVPYIARGKPWYLGDPVADQAVLIKQERPTRDGGAVVELETATDNITAVTDASGDVKAVEVQNKWLVPAAVAAAFFLFGG